MIHRLARRLTDWTESGAHVRLWASVSVAVLGFLLIGAIAYSAAGVDGLWASAIGSGICLFAILAGLAIEQVITAPDLVPYRVLIGMFPRMGVPLMFCLIVTHQGGRFMDAGLAYVVVVMYLLLLAVDVSLAIFELSLLQKRNGTR